MDEIEELANALIEAPCQHADAARPSANGSRRGGRVSDFNELRRIGELLRTQDNRITDQPIFIVQQKRTYVTADGYNESRMVWVDDEGREAGAAKTAQFDKKYLSTGKRPKGWRHIAVFDIWEFVTACFTEQGCRDYLAINGHNLTEPRIYAEGSYRNREFRQVRNFLMSLEAPESNDG